MLAFPAAAAEVLQNSGQQLKASQVEEGDAVCLVESQRGTASNYLSSSLKVKLLCCLVRKKLCLPKFCCSITASSSYTAMETEARGCFCLVSYFVFILHLRSFTLLPDATLSREPRYLPGASPLQLGSPLLVSPPSQQETSRGLAVWLCCSHISVSTARLQISQSCTCLCACRVAIRNVRTSPRRWRAHVF